MHRLAPVALIVVVAVVLAATTPSFRFTPAESTYSTPAIERPLSPILAPGLTREILRLKQTCDAVSLREVDGLDFTWDAVLILRDKVTSKQVMELLGVPLRMDGDIPGTHFLLFWTGAAQAIVRVLFTPETGLVPGTYTSRVVLSTSAPNAPRLVLTDDDEATSVKPCVDL